MALKADSIIFGCGVFTSPDLGTRPCLAGLSFRKDLKKLGKWECCCGVLGQRAITPVEDEKPLNPSTIVEPQFSGVQRTEHTGFHRDLNSLPSEFLLILWITY